MSPLTPEEIAAGHEKINRIHERLAKEKKDRPDAKDKDLNEKTLWDVPVAGEAKADKARQDTDRGGLYSRRLPRPGR